MNILIVDDSAAIRKILIRVLGQAKIQITEVSEAGNGLEALEVLRGHKIDLVLSDINMPEMDGLELLAAIRAHDDWKTIPVVMITTEGSILRVVAAVDLGASGYIRKPFTPDQIKEKLSGLF